MVSLVLPGCDLDKSSEEYRKTVPLFGAVSSPVLCKSCHAWKCGRSPARVSTALKNLFADDRLKSLSSSNESIKYDCDLCNLMSTADVNLTKWVSNDRLIVDSTPERN